ncbi:MAG: glycosyltransferase family 4 protein [Candidatus Moranbacteria bacterium]|nr:glycosyltransferase family 4 protein [Candidatus Moranbacteria bacterium]
MKKVLLVTRPITPPWDEASKNFAYFLAKTTPGFEFHVLTPGQVDALEPHIKQEHIYSSAHLDWLQRLRLLAIAPIIKKFDIAHFMLTPNKLNTWAFKTFLTSKTTKTIQTIATLREDLFEDADFKKIIFADLVITYSDYAKNKLEKLGLANIVRIYPGIDTDLYSPTSKNMRAMDLLGIKQEDFIISYPGEYTRLGATDDIVEMLPDLFEKIPTAKFIFACRVKNEKDARKKDEVVATLKERGIFEKIIFTDTFTDMPKLYNLSDVVIFPVRNMEGKFDVPLAVIEAFACEKPVIVSNLPILEEFSSSENAVMIDAKDSAQLPAAIIDLFENREKCEKIGKAARAYTLENFDIKDVANQYSEAYTKLLS